jgi:hypothetical protein
MQAGVIPDWEQAAQAGRRLHGSGPTNKQQIARIEECKVEGTGSF